MKKTAFAALLLLAAPLVAQSGPGRGPGNGTGTPGSRNASGPCRHPARDLRRVASEGGAQLRRRPASCSSCAKKRSSPATSTGRCSPRTETAPSRTSPRPSSGTWTTSSSSSTATASRTRPRRRRGEFKDTRLASLYTDLVARGRVSLVEALNVGATIEDLDLSDVGKALDASDNRDIDAVMQNLAKGSRNHLRAFSSRLTALGVPYVAQSLPAERDRVDRRGAPRAGRLRRDRQAPRRHLHRAGPGRTRSGSWRGGPGAGAGSCDGTGAGTGAGRGPGDGTGPSCPNK